MGDCLLPNPSLFPFFLSKHNVLGWHWARGPKPSPVSAAAVRFTFLQRGPWSTRLGSPGSGGCAVGDATSL